MNIGLFLGLAQSKTSIITIPNITTAGTISGSVIGVPATISGFAYTGSSSAVTYQWKLGGVNISGATSASYTPVEADNGGLLTCAITATNSAGSDTATTPSATVVYATPSQSGPFVAALTQNSAGTIDYAARVTVSGDADLSGITWSVQSGTVPTGMTRTGGVVSGTPTSTQSVAALVLRATNSGGFVDVTCDVSVAAAVAAPVSAGAIGERLVQEGTGSIGAGYGTALTGSSITYSLDSPPAGVTINSGSGFITFNTALIPPGQHTITIRGTNNGGTATNSFTLWCGPQLGVAIPNFITTVGSTERTNAINAASGLNCTIARFDFVMAFVFTSSTGRNWTEPDDYYAKAIAANIRPIFVAKNTPTWAQPGGGTNNSIPTGTALTQMATAIQEAAARYPNAIWQFLNEQNHTTFAPPEVARTDRGTAYVNYAHTMVPAIRAGNASATVISCGIAPTPIENEGSDLAAETFFSQVMAGGGDTLFDGYGYHPYSRPNAPSGTQSYNGWNMMETVMQPILAANAQAGAKFYMTEYGFPTSGTGGLAVSEANQAAWILEAWKIAAAASYMGPLIIYTLRGRDLGDTNNVEQHYGVYDGFDYSSAKPAVATMQTLKRQSGVLVADDYYAVAPNP